MHSTTGSPEVIRREPIELDVSPLEALNEEDSVASASSCFLGLNPEADQELRLDLPTSENRHHDPITSDLLTNNQLVPIEGFTLGTTGHDGIEGVPSETLPNNIISRSTTPEYSSSTNTTKNGVMSQSLNTRMWYRLEYALEQLAKALEMMVLENSTPWCHSQLYADEMPRAMQDAQACCALYMARNKANEASVFRIIHDRAKDLIAAPLPATSLEALARVQALILYQIIQLFDGDPFAHGATRRNLPDPSATIISLFQHIPKPQISPLSVSCDCWTSWVFEESARRTLAVAILLKMYATLLDWQMPLLCDMGLYCSSAWTVSAHLWKAVDVGEFMAAWREKNRFIATSHEMVHILVKAEPEDIDPCSKILLTTLMGPEEVKKWFHGDDRGVALRTLPSTHYIISTVTRLLTETLPPL
ncbi:hypothetical protein AK830_g6270 [Neonectria ditissima]|uniref:Uncharacterized protein n=1 Tax=Neonectria ditissima TaxID=78410 RepID=A0A0P7B178_9HYPO|nr:hypothetical protein AK830_g6270 [Neonectria ditissima]